MKELDYYEIDMCGLVNAIITEVRAEAVPADDGTGSCRPPPPMTHLRAAQAGGPRRRTPLSLTRVVPPLGIASAGALRLVRLSWLKTLYAFMLNTKACLSTEYLYDKPRT